MSGILLCSGLNVTGPFNLPSFDWPGGDGWLSIISGATFSGTLGLLIQCQPTDPVLPSIGFMNVPGFPVNVVGVFPFTAPKGVIAADISGSTGSVSNLTAAIYSVP